MSGQSASDLYRAAQILMRQGQPVFPCKTGLEGNPTKAKAPLTANGLLDASADLMTVKRWFRRFGACAIGIPTGLVWDVLDVDVKRDEDGRVHLPYLQRVGLLNGCKKVARTPSGGWHLYFKAAPALTNTANAALGLDVRAKGGYVLAPPSYIETPGYSGYYEDMGETTGSTDEPLHWDLIVAAIRPVSADDRKPLVLLEAHRSASIGAIRSWLSGMREGERNNALHWAVCRCIDNGIDPHELIDVALHIGLEEDETLLTINSALRRAGVTVNDLDTEAEALFPESA